MFIDVDEETHLIDGTTIRAGIGPRTRAVIVVHLHGNLPRMDEIVEVVNDHGLALIEDAAQAHGSAWRGSPGGLVRPRELLQLLPGEEPRRLR